MANSKQSTRAKTKTQSSKRAGMQAKSKSKPTKAKYASVGGSPATKRTEVKKIRTAKKSASATQSKGASRLNKISRKSNVKSFNSFKPKRETTLRTLRGLHFISVGILALLAIAAGYLINNTSYQLTIGHLAKDELMSTKEVELVLAPAVRSVYDVEIRWIVVAMMAITAILPILYLTKLTNRYALYLNRTRMLPLRWIDLAVTGSLVVGVTALLNGVSDIPTLGLLSGLIIVMSASGLIAERQNNEAKQPIRSAYTVALFAGMVPLLFILVYMFATILYGVVKLPWNIVALFVVATLLYIGWMWNLKSHLNGAKNLVTERNYLLLSLLAKITFVIVLIISLFR